MLNRRKLILALAPAAILPTASTTSIAAVNETGNANFAPSFFSPDEWRFINAAVARLIPGDGNGPGGIETGVPEFIDRQMEAPYGHGAYFYMQGPFHPDAAPTLGYQLQYTPREIYRVGIADANKSSLDSSGKSFADLTPDKQDGFLEQTEKGKISFERIPAASFFAQLLENIREGYLADPIYGGNRGMAAWKWIGFPGARADFTDWIEQTGIALPARPRRHQGSEGLMAKRERPVDAVIIGYGWTGAIMAKTLTDAGLSVVALERGPARDTSPRISNIRGSSMNSNMPSAVSCGSRSRKRPLLFGITPTMSPFHIDATARLSSATASAAPAYTGTASCGAPRRRIFRLRSHLEERYGKEFHSRRHDDPGLSRLVSKNSSRISIISRRSAARLGSRRQPCAERSDPGAIHSRAQRSDEYPTPPLPPIYVAERFENATAELGYKSFPQPSANSSIAFTNPYGVRLGPCNLCGFCERFGCFLYSKASPQTTILPILAERPNLEVRTNAYVTRILRDNTGKIATGVLYIDDEGREVEQPADLVVLSAFQMHNVRLLLLSGIGDPYDPVERQRHRRQELRLSDVSETAAYFSEDVEINPFIGAGAAGQRIIDEFNSDHFDHADLGFIGGSRSTPAPPGGRPIEQMMIPPDAPQWGNGWKTAIRKHYRHSAPIGAQGSVMSYRDSYLSLDPTYKDASRPAVTPADLRLAR